jgi:hypothetical protein
MGIKIILTESQYDRLEGRVGKLPLKEGKANLACTYMDYNSLDEELGNRDKKKIGYETIIRRVNDFTIAIKHYNTDILKIDMTNIIKVNTSGHWSVTTKDRLNQFLGCVDVYIRQRKGIWYIVGDNGEFNYEDGIEIHPGGHIVLPSGRDSKPINKNLDIDPSLRSLYGLSDD